MFDPESNSTVTLEIDVTQADIEAGRKGDCQRCPIALALMRSIDKVMGEGWRPVASFFSITIEPEPTITGGEHYIFSRFPTTRLIAFMNTFDSGNEPHPFTEEIVLNRFARYHEDCDDEEDHDEDDSE